MAGSTAGSRKRAAEAAAKTADPAYASLTWADVPHLQAQVEDLLVRETRERGWCSDADRVGRKLFTPRIGTVFVDSDGNDCNGREARDADGYGLISGRDTTGRDREGYDADGFNLRGFNRDNLDRFGFNADDPARFRFDAFGYDADGFNREGFNADGFNAEGRDRRGYDTAGLDAEGRDRRGNDADGVNKSGQRYDNGGRWYLVDPDAYKAWRIEQGYDGWEDYDTAHVVTESGGYIEGLGTDEPTPEWWTPEVATKVTDVYGDGSRVASYLNPSSRTAEQNITWNRERAARERAANA